MRTIKCPHCGRAIAVNESDQILQCVCGKAYKNPFIKSVQVYNGYAQEQTAKVMSPDDMLSDLLVLRGALYRVHEVQNEVIAKSNEISHIQSQIDENVNINYNEWTELENTKRDKLIRRQDFIYNFFKLSSYIIPIIVILLVFLLPAFGIVPYPFPKIRALLPEPFNEHINTFAECTAESYGGDYVYVICYGGGMAILVGLITFIISRIIFKFVRIGVRSAKNDIDDSDLSISRKNRRSYEENAGQRDEQNRAYASNISKLKQRINELNSSISRAMNCLESEFGGLLHTSDWGNIDYLIYLFMTGRADSKKEALQLLDKEKRTDRIVGAINGAAKYISKNISSAMNSLGNRLSSKMSEVNRSLSQINSSVRMSIATQTIAASCAMTSNQMLESIRKNTL